MSFLELSKVEFKSNSSILVNSSKKTLDSVAKIMHKHTDYHYRIQGHTDSVGNEEYNLKLSNTRAESVKNYLVSKGVKNSILSFIGLGSSNPITDNKTIKGKMINRRVVFEIVD